MKIAIAGIGGRMGLTLVRAALTTHNISVVAGSERHGFDSAELQTQLAADGCANLFITSDPDELARKAAAVIDFTTPESNLALDSSIARNGGVQVTTSGAPASRR